MNKDVKLIRKELEDLEKLTNVDLVLLEKMYQTRLQMITIIKETRLADHKQKKESILQRET